MQWNKSSFLWNDIDIYVDMLYLINMEKLRKNYNTTLRIDLIKKIKILAAEKDTRVNDLLEEAIQDLLKKYEKKGKK